MNKKSEIFVRYLLTHSQLHFAPRIARPCGSATHFVLGVQVRQICYALFCIVRAIALIHCLAVHKIFMRKRKDGGGWILYGIIHLEG